MGEAFLIQQPVAAPPGSLWAALSAVDNWPVTLRSVARVERVAGLGYRAGARWIETRLLANREEAFEAFLKECVPGDYAVHTVDSHLLRYEARYSVVSGAFGTELHIDGRLWSDKQGFVKKKLGAPGHVGERELEAMLRLDAEDIAALAAAIWIDSGQEVRSRGHEAG